MYFMTASKSKEVSLKNGGDMKGSNQLKKSFNNLNLLPQAMEY